MLTNEQIAHDLAITILNNLDQAISLLKKHDRLDGCLVKNDNDNTIDFVKAYKVIYDITLTRLND